MSSFKDHLRLESGIWVAPKMEAISYPEEGNDRYFDVESRSFWFCHRNECISILARKYNIKEPFFDIGGGNGFVAYGLKEAGYEVVLIEPGIKGCLNGKQRGLENVICATLQDSGIQEGEIPSCGLFDVVEHIEDDRSFLQDVHKAMAPGGILFLTVPAYNWLWSDEDVYIGHYRRYTVSSISKLLKEIGFSIDYKTYLFSFLVLPIFFFRRLPTLLHINTKRGQPETIQKDHVQKNMFSPFLNFLLNREKNKINKGKRINIGSSCLVVARKK